MRKVRSFLTAAGLFLALGVQAQQSTVTNVLDLKSARQSGTIIEQNKVVGYYIFYFKENEDKKMSTYVVELFDDNYNSVKEFEITRPRNTYLLESVFNGEVFMFHFYDAKIGYEFVTYTRDGEIAGSQKIDKKSISSYELQRAATNLQSATENVTIFPLGKEGFIRQTFSKNDKLGYEIIAYDNEAKVLWSYGSSETSDLVETADISDVSEQIIAASVQKKKSLMTKKFDTYCLLLNAKTGELITEMSMGTADEGKKSLLKTFVDEAKNSIVLVGEYYKPGDDVLKDKSQGLYIEEVTLEGKTVSHTDYAWKGEIDKFKQENLDAEDKKDADKPFYIFFHDVIRGANGHLYLVGEQFKKQVSAGATTMNVLVAATGGSSNVSNFEIQVANMVVMEFDAANKLVDFDLITKKKTSVMLPQGAGFWSSAFLGYYINSMGAFDYSFTSRDKASDRYSVVYIDANRREEKGAAKSDLMVGVIHIEAGKWSTSRVPLNMEAKTWWVQPAKPGYISIGEYFRKEKKVELHLEAIQY